MAICTHCGGEMTDGISCTSDPVIIGGKAYLPIRWGDERRVRHRLEQDECRDCGAPIGGVHHHGCCMERCPACGGQALGCPCDDPPPCEYQTSRAARCHSHELRRAGWR